MAPFNKITIGIASPETILDKSRGEVVRPETINYRTHKPDEGGLFCERIFGPTKNYECACGKYKRIRYKNIICDRCGVEVTKKNVRRERMGHISLAVPVVHIWYFRSLPNKIGYLLGIPSKKVDSIIYYERYAVIQPGKAVNAEGEPLQYLDFLTEDQYFEVLSKLPEDNDSLDDSDPDKFIAKMGGECIQDLLKRIDLEAVSAKLRADSRNPKTTKQKKTEALKRLQVVEAFKDSQSRRDNRPEWMVMSVIPVIPPELRPLVFLDGGRFASSDLNDLYRRVIIRNNRLKRLVSIKAPDVILRNEKRMLQESVDSLFDNTRKASAVKTEANRPLKSLSDSLKGKTGRFRQNLLGKRVDYSARSVIVVGPELKMYECGLPKEIAAELYKPFIIRKLMERGMVKTVKTAKKIIDAKEPVVWDILENILIGHPILLNRAPTLHRLGIQAFQPKMIEGRAIQLHPLACAAFNADFDGDQMAVHLPLSNEAILEAQLLMLGSNNILNPANGSPITVPSQDMVLGLYYMTKEKKSTDKIKVLGEGSVFSSVKEATIAYNEKKVELCAGIQVRITNHLGKKERIKTTIGRLLFNQIVPSYIPYINKILTKKALRDVISDLLHNSDIPTTSRFLDEIKDLGFYYAFKGGLSFSLNDIIIPEEKKDLVAETETLVDEIQMNYDMGLITNNERYNQVIDAWTSCNTRLKDTAIRTIREDQQGFNSVYMMLDSGARGSKEQISQLSGMRGLMAKPKKSGNTGAEIIENPILSNFKDGLSVLEYFISTHGARKGLADTALKTADAGYLTRRLVDVSQDVIIREDDCSTLMGIEVSHLRKNNEIIEHISDRILGRVLAEDVIDPDTGEVLVEANQLVVEATARLIGEKNVESVMVRSPLTCESKHGICSKCYGRNLSTNRMVQMGEAVGIIASQSIGEPGTQLTLRTFHVGGVAGNVSTESSIVSKHEGVCRFEDLQTVAGETEEGGEVTLVISRTTELRIVDPNSGQTLESYNIPYGAKLFVEQDKLIEKNTELCTWDPYNNTIISDIAGTISYNNIIPGVNLSIDKDENTNLTEKTIKESKDKTKIPTISVISPDSKEVKTYNLPVGAILSVEDNQQIKKGAIIVRMPRMSAKSGDITGGLPRVTELFEARNPSNPAVVSEIDGIVSFGKIKRGNQEVIVTARTGEEKKYLVRLSNQFLVQEQEYVKAGSPLSDGAITPTDILLIEGVNKVQQYLVNEIQDVYRLQGVKINDKHFEVIVRQMMQKVEVRESGDTEFLEGNVIDKFRFTEANDALFGKKVVDVAGGSTNYQEGNIISTKELRNELSILEREGKEPMQVRDVELAIAKPVLQGITKASLQTQSFISAASFQETTKVLNEAAVSAKTDHLLGLKENVIVGHRIPAGTGMREYDTLIVQRADAYEPMDDSPEEIMDDIGEGEAV